MTNLETLLKESLKPSGLRNNNVQVAPAINTKNNKNTTYNKQTDDENIDKTLSRHESSEKSPSLNPSNHLFDFHEANFLSDMINNSMLHKPLNQETRHGFDEEYTKISKFENDFLFYFDDKRHQTNGNPVDEQTIKMDKDRLYQPITDWKIGKERIKTVAAALVLCLHLGVDPPDVVKTQPCARVESSIDYLDYQDSKKAIEAIGKSLQGRYELLSPRTKYKLSLDPCVEDLKRFCNSLRKSCKNERVLFHYNGHGVPKPTTSGEIWIFNRGYTQYIPVSLYDLQNWLGAPCIYVWDCNQAELIIKNFNSFVEKRKQDDIQGKHDPAAPSTIEQYSNCYQLAACRSDEFLPMNEELPADLFTCCLTTPIEISIKIYLMQSPLKDTKYSVLFKNNKESNIRDHHNRDKNNFSKMPDIIIPGKSTDRRTPLGELNWIFTAITDTIAWTTLPRDVFNQLFRHDLITAALFRNFLLAKKLMPIYNCHPVSHPSLPDSIINHPMWKSWDLAIDQVLSKLIDSMLNPTAAISQQMLLNPKQQQDDPLLKYKSGLNSLSTMSLSSSRGPQNMSVNSNQAKNNGEMVEAGAQQQYSDFFVQNLTAFELWLKYGSSKKTPPEQLPIVLQVLLSQLHRSKALVLLANFLDLGPWAVYLSLSIGIFPYVMKLLQGPSAEMKPILVFIWARIMAIDSKNTQTELIKEDGYMYFMQMVRSDFTTPTRQIINGSAASLHSNKKFSQYKMVSNNVLQDAGPVKSDSSGITDNQKAMATFVLTCFINGFELGQKYCFNLDFIAQLIYYAENSETALLRQWSILLLSFLYKNTPLYKYVILANKNEPNYGVLTSLSKTLKDPVPEVRTATLVAMTEFISDVNEQENAYKMYQDLQMQYNNIQQQLFGLQNNPMGSSMQNQSSMITNQHQLQQQLQIIQSNMQVLQNNDIKDTKQEEVRLIVAALSVLNDGSSVVRKELVVLLSKFVNTYMSFFIVIAFVDLTEELVQNESQKPQGVGTNNKKSIGHNSIFNTVWKSMLILSEDPHEEIRALVDLVIGRILFELNDHPELGAMVLKLEKQVILKNSNVGRLTKFSSKNGNFEDGRLVKSESKNLLSSVFSSDNFSKNTTSLNDIIKKDNFSIEKKDDSDEDKNESIVGKFFGAIKTLVGNDDNEMNNFGINNNENSFSKRLAKLSLINQQYKVSPPAKAPRFDKRKLPTKLDTYLKSKFFDYSKEYFTCPQMRKEELDEPGSVNYLRKQWKTERNDRIIKTTQDEKELSLYGDWSNQIVSIENKTVPKRFKFTQFENYLVTSDERNTIRCFDWKDKDASSSSFSNGNSYGTRISDLSFINEDDDSLLVTSTSDGVMKVYKDFHSTEDTTLVACWRGFTDMLLTPRSTGLISEWQQSKGTFLIGGDVKVIRCWDALTESVEVDIPAKTSSLVTTITSDQLAGNIFAAGFSDGTIRVYDKRVDPRESIMRLWKSGSSGAGNKSSINSLKMQRGGFRELVSGNNDGAVELWDIRYQEPVFGFSATGFDGKSSMTSAQVHEHAPVIATTSKNIELWTTSGDSIGMFKNVTPLNSVVGSLTSKNLSFVNSLIFHPHRMVLAANNLHETSINIYQCMENF